MTQPFCCDITSGTKEEQNEFKRLHQKALNHTFSYCFVYYGWGKSGKDTCVETHKSAIEIFGNIIPLSEGISILKKMVGEDFYCKEYDNVGHTCESQCNICKRAENMSMVGEEEKPRTDLKVVRDRIVYAVHRSLIYKNDSDPNAKIEGINMEQLEQRIDGILDSIQPKP